MYLVGYFMLKEFQSNDDSPGFFAPLYAGPFLHFLTVGFLVFREFNTSHLGITTVKKFDKKLLKGILVSKGSV